MSTISRSSEDLRATRRLSVGAEPMSAGVHFRVWSPKRRRVDVVLVSGPGAPSEHALAPDGDGYFAGIASNAAPGTRYAFRLDGGPSYPDPASRFQPEGPHGPSEVIDPAGFPWTDAGWRGLALRGQVIYEMHVGTFTAEGTWAAATERLASLAELGVTAIEVMPVAEFPGRFGWGYDGVNFFAPTRLYGRPDDFRAFVDRAHALGLGVLLDVVYNHYGPDGNYLGQFADEYVSARRHTDWGDAPNFDGPGSAAVREYFLANASYWVDEFHLDGLRFDATQNIYDDGRPHVLAAMGAAVRAAGRGRATLTVNENETQRAQLVRPPELGGCGLDMIWNDDWHHAAMVAVTAQDEAYYTDYRGSAQEFISAVKYGFLYQGQWYRWQGARRGTPALDVEPARFVHFLSNHDQIANSGLGIRPHALTSPARWRALTALLLLGPQTPMLFMGQEFSSSAPFLYFADHGPALAARVQEGRRNAAAQFANLADNIVAAAMASPGDPASFAACKLDHAERERDGHREILALHRDLLRIRREDHCFSAQRRRGVDGAVLSADAFVLRFFDEHGDDDRLLVVNLGRTLHLDPAPEPLLAPPAGARWGLAWSSQEARYGGIGALLPDAPEAERHLVVRREPRPHENWRIQGDSAFVLVPDRTRPEPHVVTGMP